MLPVIHLECDGLSQTEKLPTSRPTLPVVILPRRITTGNVGREVGGGASLQERRGNDIPFARAVPFALAGRSFIAIRALHRLDIAMLGIA